MERSVLLQRYNDSPWKFSFPFQGCSNYTFYYPLLWGRCSLFNFSRPLVQSQEMRAGNWSNPVTFYFFADNIILRSFSVSRKPYFSMHELVNKLYNRTEHYIKFRFRWERKLRRIYTVQSIHILRWHVLTLTSWDGCAGSLKKTLMGMKFHADTGNNVNTWVMFYLY